MIRYKKIIFYYRYLKGILSQDIQRPLYMSAQDAIEYGIIDKIIQKDSNAIDKVMNVEEWDRTAGLVRAN